MCLMTVQKKHSKVILSVLQCANLVMGRGIFVKVIAASFQQKFLYYRYYLKYFGMNTSTLPASQGSRWYIAVAVLSIG